MNPFTADKRPLLSRLQTTRRLASSAVQLGVRRGLGMDGSRDGMLGDVLAAELDQMKGMAMKVGQILSYFDGILPADAHAALRMLQLGVTRMPTAQVTALIEAELGQPPAVAFSRFDLEPVASASIGQVHRARLGNDEVAVKVQYPHISTTIERDFSRLQHLSGLISTVTSIDGQAVTAELRDNIAAECDYRAEASAQNAFRSAFANDTAVAIPAVFDSHSARRVLTTCWHDGQNFYQFVASASATQRHAAADVLLQFALRCAFALGSINADPHPGNYLFEADGRVTFLDFGAVRVFDADFIEGERQLAKIIIDNRRAAFRPLLRDIGMVHNDHRFDYDLHWELLRHQYMPFWSPSFHFSAEFVRRAFEFSGPKNPNLRHLVFAPQWIWLQRLQWGLYAVLARLGASGSYGDLLRTYLAQPVTPLTLSVPHATV